jgi:phosphate transport system ATP-binding protein
MVTTLPAPPIPAAPAPARPASAAVPGAGRDILIDIDRVDFCYGTNQTLHGVTLQLEANKVTAFIGPSGCGKSTLLRCLNRMNDLVDGARITAGSIRIHGVDIHRPDVDVIELRKRVGMVFQKSNPFPK